jgi:hypothetical protein
MEQPAMTFSHARARAALLAGLALALGATAAPAETWPDRTI